MLKKMISLCYIILATTMIPGCTDNDTPAKIVKAPAVGTPFVAGTFISLKSFGYEQKEFFFSGTAYSYKNSLPMTRDGKWEVAPVASAAYKTRMLVYRPADPAKFNGTVIVEWLNVTAGLDTAAEWVMMHTEMLRRGYCWVGISAQYVGVEGGKTPLPTPLGTSIPLKTINYLRYCSLSHPGDSFSYDIFAQGIRFIRYPERIAPLGTLKVKRIIAAGESQSATRLMTFMNAFGRNNDCIDGYFIHSRLGFIPDFGGASAPLSQSPQEYIPAPSEVTVREDLGKPVLNLQTETDMFVLDAYASRQNDSDTFRLWEVAGTAHADEYIINSGMYDKGEASSAEVVITEQPNLIMQGCGSPVNAAPQHHFAANAALHALNNWLVNGILPPSAPRLAVNESGNGFICDMHGNVRGGVRSPYVDAPIARFSGENSSVRNDTDICFLFGETQMLDDTVLKELYPDHNAYVAAVTKAARNAIAKGFLLEDDANLIISAAGASTIPPQ